ncbi:MAG TPA: aromatic ring-hydroxylating dioxygenase subunit alpha [Alphaproteobacteria bacterium]|nr:aromatic ring-hydroxylating dioxygenase subunit alpha [Alphaproteobacteria bacterium]
MERAGRIAIAKQVLQLIESGKPYLGEESWEVDVGRFIDKDRFLLEKQKLFLERPQLIALSADLPKIGDYFATDIAGKPILLVRGKDGKARAFLNACRHRGVKLAEEGCGHAAGFTCPYHGWTYALDGALTSVPSRMSFEEHQLKNRGLIPLPTAEEIGVIVVHPDPHGELDFDEFLGPMKDVLEDMDLGSYEQVSRYREPARINWKHAVDGGMEAYHVQFLHPTTFRTDGGGFLPHIQFGQHHAFITSGPEMAELKDKPESEWPKSCGWGSVNAIFPNTVIGGGGRQNILFFQRTEPMDEPGVCNYNYRLYAKPARTAEEKQAVADGVKLFMKVALEEDMPTQVSSQIMMESGAVPSVIFGKREACLVGMHRGYDEAIGHDAATALRNNAARMGISPTR